VTSTAASKNPRLRATEEARKKRTRLGAQESLLSWTP
jgi:hypothetical protein